MGNDFSECEDMRSKLTRDLTEAYNRIEVLERKQEPYRRMLETMCLSFCCRYEIFPDGSYRLEAIPRFV